MATSTDLRPIFNLADLETFSIIYNACSEERPCKWTPDGGETVVTGVMRRLTYRSEVDVRDYEVQISGTSEYFLPIIDVVRMIRNQEFFVR